MSTGKRLKPTTKVNRRRLKPELQLSLAVLTLTLLALPRLILADEQPATQPAPDSEAPALRLARHDAARWAERAKALADAASQSNAAFEIATKAVADAKAAVAAGDKALADVVAAIAVAEQGKVAADKSLGDAQEALKKIETEKKDDAEAINAGKAAVDAAQKNVETIVKQLTDALEKKKQAEMAKAAADKKVSEVEQAVKPATDAKASADKVAGEAQTALKLAQDRLAAFEKGVPKADPMAVRLVQTITHDRPVLTCRFDPNGDFLFAGAEDNNFHRWDLFTGSSLHLKGHRSWIGTLSLPPVAGNIVITGGHEGKLAWWNGLDAAPASLRIVDAHKGYIRAVAFSPDGRLIATGGNDNFVRVWSATDGTLVKELAGHTRHVYNVAFHPSGTALVSGDLLGVLNQWAVGSWKLTRDLDAKVLSKYDPTFKADVGGIRGIDFSPDGKSLAVAGITEVSNAFAGIGEPAVVLFDWESGKQLKLLKPKEKFQGSVAGVRFHPSGEFLIGAGGGGAGGMWFWKPDDEKSFHAIALASNAYDLALHPDGLRLAVPLFDKTIRIYDLAPKLDVAAK
jgi:WD40 repeat protein